ncbi:MAG TPA: SRPBCC family protein [Pyrinomonadaceae bacterium]|nr:SRPBCC family protein [Acidobacteriota bacterium]HQZ95034.1 SRPBCC family protein [Pyrinomonadaceae bacterium]
MAEHVLTRKQTLYLPIKEVFDFFADAGNLERITPPELNFQIITPQPIDIYQSTLIDYKLKIRGISVKWRTEISVWEPPFRFIDQQLRGPYRQWIHTHTFTELSPTQTLMEDEVRYRLPFEPLGDLAHFFVKSELAYIFDYRQKVVTEILTSKN